MSTQGNDKYPGTKEKPVASFAQAQTLARAFSTQESVEVLFANGTYYLPQTIVFTPQDNTANKQITYKAAKEGKAIISGGSLLYLKWKPIPNGLFVAHISGNPVIDQLYVNGVRQRMARFPNAVAGKNVFDTWELSHTLKSDSANNPLDPKRIARWKNPQGGYLHAMHSLLWGDMHWLINGQKADGKLDYEGGWQNNRPSTMHPCYRMVENIFEELDAPSEWFYNATEHKLYFMPDAQTNLKTAKVEIVRLKNLIEFSGTKATPVKNIHLQGFVFRHAARTFMENKEPLLRSDWTVFRGGAVFFNGAADCSVQDCEFDQVGGNALFVNNYNRRIVLTGCYIHNSGASGVAFVGDPATVRSPIFKYGKQNYTTIDRTPGPKDDNYPEDCLVENCLITLTGRDEKQTAPVHISMSHKIHVNHCSIYDVPRAGININEGTFGGHLIENCDVFNTVLETGDHGSFNSWGRDRYWTPDVKETCREVESDSTLPFLDMLDPNIIRNNRWRCDHGWDIDLDDGSTNYRIYNNLLLNGGLKLREGYSRMATNNVIINNGLHPHVWYLNSGDVFKNNIVCKAYQPAIMNKAIAADGKWGTELDSNFYVTQKSERTKFAQNGCELNSLNGDPQFIDPSNGNFQVKETSPALKIGFQNFPMEQFGVTKPSLKVLAKTPQIPVVEVIIKPEAALQQSKTVTWLGVVLNEPSGDEMSAFGVAFDAGGVSLTSVADNAEAAKLGFRTGDLLLEINGVSVRKLTDLKEYLLKNALVKKHNVRLIRNQAKMGVTVESNLPFIAK
ncbi:MAG: right-handed parallel beta-helix repeat-containing protein [Bacteroidia bacterium]|nr:right-handed parallel beta-helix repeat-containing protein [Bacteroidia bacterium]